MNYVTDESGKTYSRFYPFPTSDVTISTDVVAISGETINFKAGAAGFKGILALGKNKITNVNGDKIGSHWREQQNLLFENAPNTARVSGIVETAGSATISIKIDTNNNAPNLEQLFEVSSGNSQYVLLAIDPMGNELYGFIRGISVSGSIYTITINSTLAGGTQDWVGSTANFNGTDATKLAFKIFSYESSISFTTGTILLAEKPCDPAKSDLQILNEVLTANGDYAVDYYRGRIFYRKATSGTSDTVTYKTRAQTGVSVSGASDITSIVPGTGATNLGKAEDAAHANGDVGIMVLTRRTDAAASSTGTDGDYATMNTDSLGHVWSREGFAPVAEDNPNGILAVHHKPLAVSTYAWSVDKSTALEASSITKNAPGTLRKIEGRIDSTAPTATYYFQIINSTTLPANGAVTTVLAPKKIQHTNGADTHFTIDCEDNGVHHSIGIVQCLSSTEFTKTISGAYLSTNAFYI